MRRRSSAARSPFVLLIVLLLGGGLITLLLLNSAVNRDSFKLSELQKKTTQYTDEEQYSDNGGQAGEELIHCGASFA